MSKGMLSKTAWRLMKSYWKSKEKWRARGLLAGVIALSLGQVYMLVMLNQWNNVFYNALQERDFEVFWPLIGQFSLIAFGYIIMAVYAILWLFCGSFRGRWIFLWGIRCCRCRGIWCLLP